AYIVRRTLIIGIFMGVFAVVVSAGVMISMKKAKETIPKPTPAPSFEFGRIPPIHFPPGKTYPSTFELQTIAGRPPEGTPSSELFFIPSKTPTLFSRRNAADFAEQLGFTGQPTTISDTLYHYTDEATNSTFTLDITNQNFLMKRNYLDPSMFEEKINPTQQNIKQLAVSYFQSLKVWDTALSESKITYLTLEGTTLTPTSKLENAQVYRIDFFRGPIEGYPVVTSLFHTSPIYLIFAANTSRIQNILEASFQNFPPLLGDSATYPTISGQAAWEQLQNGKGYIAVPLQTGTQAVIRTVYLAYFQEDQYHPYLQLVWVFEGDHGFVGMVPALDPVWIEQ
ncbi:hypothetical protein HY468_05320, partial [Candidatus Roizmanbacteria bacterium]|nr:hypothetical protein [Candidatus Roizmanbacteria bacterium]